ncbi:T7SS effector LXG polymorphic toxin [Bacillus atrophaeus]|uniref:T7SS effector LXG polymorphic toxin n=1 Tax=Bacillus atrophaeus TaxID=1452 RepID=UPI00227F9486|nr:T7SS effector LXG polymorphic toxin [Bacillus atrophaeus]MCY8467308.1 T7SS effector LXG polymorphic toxin [Bacillus atrophaeus]MCY8479928.1 T7SS effector LXG polymorphic toxin [Bacillus atrophaeus]
MKIYEANTLISEMEARSRQYKKTREQFINLQKAFMDVANLGEALKGKGADNIKAFYKEHARNVDDWLDMLEMKIAFFDSIAATLEEADLAGNTFVDTSFLENELENAHKRSKGIVGEQKKAIKAILEDINDIVPLEVFSTADFKQHLSDSKAQRENTVDKVNETDSKLVKEYEKSQENQDYIKAKNKALIDATGKGKNAKPIHFNAKAYYDTKVFKQGDKIHKKTQEYLAVKKEEAEKHKIKELKEKLAKVSDPDEYLEIAKEIGYENLTPDQKQYVLQLEQMNQEKDILKGIGVGLKDVVVDTATGIWDTVTKPDETLEGIGQTILHPVKTFNIIKKGIEDSYQRDMVNGDSYSRARWVTYAIGMVGTSIVGTKGADKVGKVSKAGKIGKAKAKDASKKAVSKGVNIAKKASNKAVGRITKDFKDFKSMLPNPPLFGPQLAMANSGKIPFNSVDGARLKDKLIHQAKKASDQTREIRSKVSDIFSERTSKEKSNIKVDSKSIHKVKYGNHFTRVKRRKVLKPNVEYITPIGYTYKTDHKGRIVSASGKLNLGAAKRNKYAQKISGREDRLKTDEGGHLIATIFKGSGKLDNLVPMDGNLNKGEWKKLENMWAKQLDKGRTVEVKIQPVYKGDSQRPASFEIEYKIGNRKWDVVKFDNKPGGK